MFWAVLKKFGCSDTGKGIVLFIIPGVRSIALKVVALLLLGSIGFSALSRMVGVMLMFPSFNFVGNTTEGADTPFMARD